MDQLIAFYGIFGSCVLRPPQKDYFLAVPWRGSFGRILTMQLEPPKYLCIADQCFSNALVLNRHTALPLFVSVPCSSTLDNAIYRDTGASLIRRKVNFSPILSTLPGKHSKIVCRLWQGKLFGRGLVRDSKC